jgi:hypothetical protein
MFGRSLSKPGSVQEDDDQDGMRGNRNEHIRNPFGSKLTKLSEMLHELAGDRVCWNSHRGRISFVRRGVDDRVTPCVHRNDHFRSAYTGASCPSPSHFCRPEGACGPGDARDPGPRLGYRPGPFPKSSNHYPSVASRRLVRMTASPSLSRALAISRRIRSISSPFPFRARAMPAPCRSDPRRPPYRQASPTARPARSP